MENIPEYLQYRANLQFRSIFNLTRTPQSLKVDVQVISVLHELSMDFDHPRGLPAYFFYHYHSPMRLTVSGQVYHTAPNTFILIPPGCPVSISSRWPWRGSWIRCRGAEVGQLVAESGIPAGVPVAMNGGVLAVELLLGIYREMRDSQQPDPDNILDYLRIWTRHIRRQAAETKHEKTTAPSAVIMAKQYIETHYLEPVDVKQLTHRFGVSKSALYRAFRECYGTTPIEMAIQMRLQHAVELLENDALNVTEVSYASGFKDVYYFSRQFKQRMGVTPSQFRQRLISGGVT